MQQQWWKEDGHHILSPGWVLLGILSRCLPPASSNPDSISDQKMSFSTPVFRPGPWAEIMSLLLRLQRKQKNSSNPFRIRIFLFLSYSFGIETLNAFIYSVVSSITIPVFRPKRRKNPTLWGGTNLYGFYKRVPPPPGFLLFETLDIMLLER